MKVFHKKERVVDGRHEVGYQSLVLVCLKIQGLPLRISDGINIEGVRKIHLA
jgi:hypothetical protein